MMANQKLENLLNLFNLKELQISALEEMKKLDWKQVAKKQRQINELLRQERAGAEVYLKSVLEKRVVKAEDAYQKQEH